MSRVEIHSIPQTGGTKYEIVKYEGPVAVSRVSLTKRTMSFVVFRRKNRRWGSDD